MCPLLSFSSSSSPIAPKGTTVQIVDEPSVQQSAVQELPMPSSNWQTVHASQLQVSPSQRSPLNLSTNLCRSTAGMGPQILQQVELKFWSTPGAVEAGLQKCQTMSGKKATQVQIGFCKVVLEQVHTIKQLFQRSAQGRHFTCD